MKRSSFKYFLATAALAGLIVFSLPAKAQTSGTTPQIFITWQAHDFYPSDYPLKAFSPTDGNVSASVMVVQNQKATDLANVLITWLLDNKLVKSGKGLQNVTFKVDAAPGDSNTLRTIVFLDSGQLQTSVQIPVVRPIVAVNNPFSGGSAPKNTSVTISAQPFFFNIDSLDRLRFTWLVNGAVSPGSGNVATLNTGSPQFQSLVDVVVRAENIIDPTETGSGEIKFAVQ